MEKILIYQVKEKEAVKQLLAPMKIRLEEIKTDRKSTRLNSSHTSRSRMPSSA